MCPVRAGSGAAAHSPRTPPSGPARSRSRTGRRAAGSGGERRAAGGAGGKRGARAAMAGTRRGLGAERPQRRREGERGRGLGRG